MAGAEVLPIRSMKPHEKRKWVQQLWGLLTAEKNKEAAAAAAARGRDRASSTSNARFEAPRPRSKSPLPPSSPGRTQSPSPPAIVTAPITQLETLSLNTALADGTARPLSPSPSPSPSPAGSLRRSNATTTTNRRLSQSGPLPVPAPERPRRFSNARNLAVPGANGSSYPYLSDGEEYLSSGDEKQYERSRSPGGFGGLGDGGLTRLLSVKRPNDSVLADAMSLALFRVVDD
jgi:hypothetical protein